MTHNRDHWNGNRKHTPPCSSEELFFAEKGGGRSRGKISVVDVLSRSFLGVFVSTTGLEKVCFEGRKVLQKIVFRWCSCTLFLLCNFKLSETKRARRQRWGLSVASRIAAPARAQRCVHNDCMDAQRTLHHT